MLKSTPATQALLYAALFLVGVSIAIVFFLIARNAPTVAPRLCMRGLKRQKAMSEGGLFAAFEPLVRVVASWFSRIPMPDFKRNIDRELMYAGDYLGLTSDEFLALSSIGCVTMGVIGFVSASVFELPVMLGVLMTLLGFFMVRLNVNSEKTRRFKEINRGLPAAIDLAALCMGAGLDFPGALRQYTDKSAKNDSLNEELSRVLQDLQLGRTRRMALENLAERAPTDAVRDFVGSVVQAEEKGNPLAEVLRIQAQMLRMRRSITAEENAAKAALKLMIPLMFIFCAIIIVLMGPFIVNAMGKGI
ncbi:MAG: type II secretion system F family protein [Sandaracinaceae bacterium]|nr:type II secretion system F family protein [Sandaracinaceae bacterium]